MLEKKKIPPPTRPFPDPFSTDLGGKRLTGNSSSGPIPSEVTDRTVAARRMGTPEALPPVSCNLAALPAENVGVQS